MADEMVEGARGVLIPTQQKLARIHKVVSPTCIEIVNPDGYIDVYLLEGKEKILVSGERIPNPHAGEWTPADPYTAGEYRFELDLSRPVGPCEFDEPEPIGYRHGS